MMLRERSRAPELTFVANEVGACGGIVPNHIDVVGTLFDRP